MAKKMEGMISIIFSIVILGGIVFVEMIGPIDEGICTGECCGLFLLCFIIGAILIRITKTKRSRTIIYQQPPPQTQ